MENSIEEDIKILESIIKINNDYLKDTENQTIKAIEHILSDYKRVLKENKILKDEKAEAWEEWNNLEQGSYETEQKLKQQIKELQKENEKLHKEIEEMKSLDIYKLVEDWETGQLISVQKVKDIIDRIDYDIKKTKEIISKNTNIYASYRKNDYQIIRLRAMNTKSLDIKKRLQKLLESEK